MSGYRIAVKIYCLSRNFTIAMSWVSMIMGWGGDVPRHTISRPGCSKSLELPFIIAICNIEDAARFGRRNIHMIILNNVQRGKLQMRNGNEKGVNGEEVIQWMVICRVRASRNPK